MSKPRACAGGGFASGRGDRVVGAKGGGGAHDAHVLEVGGDGGAGEGGCREHGLRSRCGSNGGS